VLLFGGYSAVDGKLAAGNALWSYDTKAGTWTDLKPVGALPPNASRATMVFDPAVGKLILRTESGKTGSRVLVTWAYDPKAKTWADMKPSGASPPELLESAMVYDTSKRRALLFGGVGDDMFSHAWAYDAKANTWTDLKPTGTVPPARRGGVLAFDPAGKRVILFGGWTAGDGLLNDTWSYTLATNTWKNLKPVSAPPARYLASMTYDTARKRMVLYGGLGKHIESLLGGATYEYDQMSDIWIYDPAKNTWTSLAPKVSPSSRGLAPLVYDESAGKLVLLGGLGSEGLLDDTWTLKL
jgi:N-acetylneuraminic acid mutarotase